MNTLSQQFLCGRKLKEETLGETEQVFRTRWPQHSAAASQEHSKCAQVSQRSPQNSDWRSLLVLFAPGTKRHLHVWVNIVLARMLVQGKDRLMVTMQVWMRTWYCPSFYIWIQKSMGSWEVENAPIDMQMKSKKTMIEQEKTIKYDMVALYWSNSS